MEIVPIVLSALALVGVLILIILFLKKPKHEVDHSNDIQFGALGEQIKNLDKDLTQEIKLQIQQEMINLQKNQIQTNEDSNQRLIKFQTGINESIEKKFTALNELVQNKLLEINKQVNERLEGGFKNTNETFTSVMERLAKIDEAQKNIETLSGEVVSLKNVLENNQARGQYGEFQLESILHNVFGDTVGLFEMQYTIKKGSTEEDTIRPDAVVFLPDPYKMVCIDSKFPFQNYQRLFANELSDTEKLALDKTFKSDIKKHIDTIAGKYILKGKTIEQAIMFIPNDGIFAYIHVTFQDLIEYAQKNTSM
jgi:DNA recombination protein RmuC